MEMQLALANAVKPPKAVADFIEWTEGYQSNHYGNFDTDNYLRLYLKLPQEMKDAIKYSSRGILWRGDEFYREDLYDQYKKGKTFAALSFTPNHGVASHFGEPRRYSKLVESHGGSIDTKKLVRYLDKMKYDHYIGDDEGEVIYLQVKLK